MESRVSAASKPPKALLVETRVACVTGMILLVQIAMVFQMGSLALITNAKRAFRKIMKGVCLVVTARACPMENLLLTSAGSATEKTIVLIATI